MVYLNEGLKQFLLLSDIELKKRISDHKGNLPVKDYILAGALFGIIGAATLSTVSEEYRKHPEEFKRKLEIIEAELENGLKAHDLTAKDEIRIKKALTNIAKIKKDIILKEESSFLQEGVLNFIKKQNYNYLKKVESGSLITSEELILGFCIGAIPAVVTAHLVRNKLQKDPNAFKQKIEKIKEELEAAKKEKELDEEENSKTNKMILKITALNVLVSNIIKGINNRNLKHTKEI